MSGRRNVREYVQKCIINNQFQIVGNRKLAHLPHGESRDQRLIKVNVPPTLRHSHHTCHTWHSVHTHTHRLCCGRESINHGSRYGALITPLLSHCGSLHQTQQDAAAPNWGLDVGFAFLTLSSASPFTLAPFLHLSIIKDVFFHNRAHVHQCACTLGAGFEREQPRIQLGVWEGSSLLEC